MENDIDWHIQVSHFCILFINFEIGSRMLNHNIALYALRLRIGPVKPDPGPADTTTFMYIVPVLVGGSLA